MQNVCEPVVILSEDGTLKEMTRDYIRQVLDETKGIIGGPSGAARRMGFPRTTLTVKLKKLWMPHRRSARLSGGDRASLPA